MVLIVRMYEANRAHKSIIDEYCVDPSTVSVMDLLIKLRASPKLYNKHARFGTRLRTYHDFVPGALINDVVKDPSALTKTLDELQLQYEDDGTLLRILVEGCQSEADAAENTAEQSWYLLSHLAHEMDSIKKRLARAIDAAAAGDITALHRLSAQLSPHNTVGPADFPHIRNMHLNRDGYAPLHLAAKEGRVETIRALVELGADVNAVTTAGYSVLYVAAQHGHVDTIRALVDLGAGVNDADTDACKPLFIAARRGKEGAVRALVELGADMTGSNSPLNVAAYNGHVETVRALIELGVDACAVDEQGLTALYFAAQNGHEEAMNDYTLLSPSFYSAEADGSAPLDKADCYCESPTNTALYGLRVHEVTLAYFDGYSPLFTASLNGHHETIRALHALGADVDAATPTGYRSIDMAVYNGHVETVRVLSELGTDVNAATTNGCRPLYVAAFKGNIIMVRALVDLGADVNATTTAGCRAIDMAVYNGHVETVRALVELGADVNGVTTNGVTALHIAAKNCTFMVRALVELGADVNAVTTAGCRPIDMAAYAGHVNTVRALAELGAEVNAGDGNRLSALCAMPACVDTVGRR